AELTTFAAELTAAPELAALTELASAAELAALAEFTPTAELARAPAVPAPRTAPAEASVPSQPAPVITRATPAVAVPAKAPPPPHILRLLDRRGILQRSTKSFRRARCSARGRRRDRTCTQRDGAEGEQLQPVHLSSPCFWTR